MRNLFLLISISFCLGYCQFLLGIPQDFVRPIILTIEQYPIKPSEIEYLKKVRPYGILMYGKRPNVTESALVIPALKKQLNRPDLLFFIDHEGGTVNRFHKKYPKRFPSARSFGEKAEKNLDQAKKDLYANASDAGKLIKEVGFNGVFGPAAELCLGENFLTTRCYSKDPHITAELAETFAQAMSDAGLEPAYKHLPGIAGADKDNHKTKSTVNRTLDEIRNQEAVAMKYAKNWQYAMTSHVLYPSLDPVNIATYSPKVNQFIRKELGFEGFIVTDSLNMEGSFVEGLSYGERMQKALEAGADLVVPVFNTHSTQKRWQEIQKISPEQIKKFNKKLRRMKKRKKFFI